MKIKIAFFIYRGPGFLFGVIHRAIRHVKTAAMKHGTVSAKLLFKARDVLCCFYPILIFIRSDMAHIIWDNYDDFKS